MLIFLIGFMGSGKTSVGRHLARNMHYRFIDLDAVIEEREIKTIQEIFDQHGESYFRQCESKLLSEVYRDEGHRYFMWWRHTLLW